MKKLVSLSDLRHLVATDRICGLMDQAFFTASTFIVTFVYARYLEQDAFGIFALVLGICLVVQGIQRAICVLPMIVTSTDGNVSTRWVNFDLLTRIMTSCILATGALMLHANDASPTMQNAVAMSAICSFATLAYEFQRRCLFVQQRAQKAALVAVAYLTTSLICASIVIYMFKSALAAVAGLTLSASIAAAIARWLRKPSLKTNEALSEHLPLVSWNLLSYAAYAVYNNGMIVIVGVMSDVKTVALYSASRLFTAPIQTLLQAVDSVDTPRARREFLQSGHKALARSLKNTQRTLLFLSIPYLGFVGLFAPFANEYLFENRFPDMTYAIYAWCVVSMIMMLSQTLEIGLTILRKEKIFFWTRLIAAIITISMLYLLMNYCTSLAPIISLSAGWSISGILAWFLLKNYLRMGQEK